eukprot:6322034-Alexandrium_andersonii.AAC.1
MSASLVGSEMCIRDSLSPSGSDAARQTSGELAPAHERRLLRSRRKVRWPVSYTHLTLPTICSV